MPKQRPAGRPAKASARPPRIAVKLHRNVSLIKTNDGHFAEEMLTRKKLAALRAGRLTDEVLLVRPGLESAVIDELRKIGHTPQVIRGGNP